MSRKPIDLVAIEANGKPYGRRAVWLAIREMGEFTIAQLRNRVVDAASGALIADYLLALSKGGYIERVETEKRNGTYKLVLDCGVDAPRLRRDGTLVPCSGQQNMWVAMRIVGFFTPRELMEAASTKAAPITMRTAESYVRHLHAAGYLCAASGGDEERYRLVRDTGGLSPMVQRTKCVFDPNLNSIVAHEAIEP